MIVLVSGGLDSVIVWRLLDWPEAVTFELSTRAREKEHAGLTWAMQACVRDGRESRLHGLVMPMASHEQENGYLPHRNALMILRAMQVDPEVVVPMIAEWAPDKNLRFFRRLEQLALEMRQGQQVDDDRKPWIIAPFARWTKAQLLQRHLDMYGGAETIDLLQHTWSCYGNAGFHCGRCSGCRQRWVAEKAVFGSTVTSFIHEPTRDEIVAPVNARDFLRWWRGNGHRSLPALARRARETSQALTEARRDALPPRASGEGSV